LKIHPTGNKKMYSETTKAILIKGKNKKTKTETKSSFKMLKIPKSRPQLGRIPRAAKRPAALETATPPLYAAGTRALGRAVPERPGHSTCHGDSNGQKEQ
jgi:hypothetical protein